MSYSLHCHRCRRPIGNDEDWEHVPGGATHDLGNGPVDVGAIVCTGCITDNDREELARTVQSDVRLAAALLSNVSLFA